MADASNQVNLFIPCEMDLFSPLVAHSVVEVLERQGVTIHYNEEQTCCGRKFFFAGETEYAKNLGYKMMSEYEDSPYPIVIPSSGCAGYIRRYFGNLLTNMSMVNSLKTFISNTYELCDYLVNVRGLTTVNNCFDHRVFYFKSCSARNMYGEGADAAEILLSNTKRLVLLHDPNMIECCAANGKFATSNPEMSEKLLEIIVNKIYAMGAQFVTSTDIHCLQHLESFIQSKGMGLEVIHVADILNSKEDSVKTNM